MGAAAVRGPLLERSEELARIESALSRARSGRGSLVVIEGPAGIGKTVLLESARSAAVENGMRVLRACGTELEREFAFGAVRQLFEAALAEASDVERSGLLDGAAGVAATLLDLPGAAPAGKPQEPSVDASFAILHGLYWLCANLGAGGPVCLVVDDAHWVDTPSLRYLAFLLTRLEELNVAVVVASRPHEEGADAELFATVLAAPTAELVRPAPLTRPAVAELVEAGLGAAAAPAFVYACLQASGGTPFLLHELIGALEEEAIAPTAGAAALVQRIGARSIGRSMDLRLRRLPDHAQRLARAVAVLERSDLIQAARLAELDEAEAVEAAELLARAGILAPGASLTFAHPIIRGGIYSELSAAERAQAHRQAAQLLAELPGTRELVAQHLLDSSPAADAWVVEQLAAAAQAAREQGAPELEAVYLRRALAEPVVAERRPQLLLELGIAEANAGIEGWDEHLQQAVEAAPGGRATARAARTFARALNRAQRFADAVDVLDRAAAMLGPDEAELALRLEAAAVVVGMNELVASPAIVARRKALRDRVHRSQTAPPDVLAAAAFIGILGNEPGAAEGDLALLAEAGLADAADQGGLSAIDLFARTTLSLLWAERYAELVPMLDSSIAQARETGESGMLALALAIRSWVGLRRGDLNAAEADARTALAATELPAPALYRVLNRGLLAGVLVERGDLDAAEQQLARLGSEAEQGSMIASVVRFARGRLHREQGRAAEALEDFLAVGAVLTEAHVFCPSYLPWRSDAALAHLVLGNQDEARRLAEEELELAQAFAMPRAVGVAKRAVALVEGGERGKLLLREAIESFERAGAGLERIRSLADLGAMLRRDNRRAEARVLLREALDHAHRAGAVPLALRAETELRATGARPRRAVLTGLESLTASERRIAELAGKGHTNREIAQFLFVTDRTVEGHLTSVFRKLRLDSRTELPGVLAADVPVSA